MLIYNVTIKVVASIQQEWLDWLQQEHVPEVLATGCFKKATICRLLETDDTEGPTFSVQYLAPGRDDYDRYIEKFAPALRQKSFDRWGDRFIAFRSLLQVIN
jgi:hypothetical protein